MRARSDRTTTATAKGKSCEAVNAARPRKNRESVGSGFRGYPCTDTNGQQCSEFDIRPGSGKLAEVLYLSVLREQARARCVHT